MQAQHANTHKARARRTAQNAGSKDSMHKLALLIAAAMRAMSMSVRKNGKSVRSMVISHKDWYTNERLAWKHHAQQAA